MRSRALKAVPQGEFYAADDVTKGEFFDADIDDVPGQLEEYYNFAY